MSHRSSTEPSTHLSRRSLPATFLEHSSDNGLPARADAGVGVSGGARGARGVKGGSGVLESGDVGNIMQQFKNSFRSTTGNLNEQGTFGANGGGSDVANTTPGTRFAVAVPGVRAIIAPPPKTPSAGSHVRGHLR